MKKIWDELTVSGEQGDRSASPAGSSSSADAMNVIL